MKKFYAILCLAIASLTQLQAQAPQGFNYQATVRNSSGDLIVNTNVYFKFNVIQGSQTAVPIFTETHYVPTDDLGQVNLIIGQGTSNTGTFSALDWSLGSYYLGIELDTGDGYVAMGTTQLLSVPYALYAENTGNSTPTTPNLETVLAENNSANNQQIKNLQDPTDDQDAATKAYVDTEVGNNQQNIEQVLNLGNDANGLQLKGIANPTDAQDAVTKDYLLEKLSLIQDQIAAMQAATGSGTVTDQDGNSYTYLTYGEQVWTVKNAEVVTYRDGTPIPQVTDATDWSNLTTGAWCYYDNDPTKHRLYNWYAVMGIHDTDPNTPNKEFAPEGWHVPSITEWKTLENHLIVNGYNYDGTTTGNKIAKAMASTTGWSSSTNTVAVGNDQSLNNSSGFNAIPEGDRYNDGSFAAESFNAIFWSSNEYSTNNAWYRSVNYGSWFLYTGDSGKQNGYSVRFVRGFHPNDIDNDNDGFTENQGDCNDTDASTYPGATELEDGKDNDCDGEIDEVNGGGGETCTPELTESYSAANLNVTFQTDTTADFISSGVGFAWIDNPDADNAVNTSCKVGQVERGNINPWDNIQYDLDAKLDFNANTGFKIKVWSARPNTEVRLKLEEIGNAGNNTEQFLTTSVTSGWEELTFPFTAADSDKFNKIVIFFDLNTTSTDTYYFDDLMLYGDGSDSGGVGGSLTDQDGNTYEFKSYGDQTWSVENAEMVTYRDGTVIPQVIDNAEWQNLTTGAWAYYDNDPTKPRLYNWYAVMGIHDTDPNTPNKEFAPEGWHVPTDAEWTELENYLIANGYNYDGTTTGNKIAKSMASKSVWNYTAVTGQVGHILNRNNSSGFNAFPYGYRLRNGEFFSKNDIASFWSSTIDPVYEDGAYHRSLGFNDDDLHRGNNYLKNGISVRFVRDYNSVGRFDLPDAPTHAAADVISIFSDVYENIPVDFYNGHWEPYQTTTSADFDVNGDNILSYENFNFVGHQFGSPTVDASQMTHFHFDVFIPGSLLSDAKLKVTIKDFGADGVYDTGDDTTQVFTLTSADLTGDAWSSIDIPLSLSPKSKIGQLIYENDGSNVTALYLDNVYFYKN